MTSSNEATWLTQEAHDRLRDELIYLLETARKDIARKIQEAREEGDLKENGGYHAAKEEQGKIEARIARLESLLASAEVGEAPEADGEVRQGMVVKITLGGSEMEFLLGSAEIAQGTEIDVYSPDSPLGSAIIGHKVGETLSFFLPNGREKEVEIIAVRHFEG
jgi:transcription elongation factor GreA